ncbi:uncharacterized protein LOC127964005 [Carassius gibelio]|uniref:uncharacterized protein LOC127964005 n=1 Tax=Carassius gibelio TaxID=101364 RepID=UPI002278E59A|nr:uncharacterized protein LOC127964005 [Carassius gibelio]
MTFNKDLTGQYVTLRQKGQLASRDTSSFMNGLAFLSRTVEVAEKLCIRIENRTSLWDGALHVGFTNICPQKNGVPPASVPHLRDTRGYCVVPVPEDLCRCGVQLQFWINYAGMVIVQKIGGEKYYLKAERLNLNNPLWVFIDLYGSTSAVRLLRSRRGSQTSCPDRPVDSTSGINLLARAVERQTSEMNTHTLSRSHSPPPVPAQQRHRLTSTSSILSDLSPNSSMEDMDFISLLREFQHMHLSGSEHVSVLVSRNKVLQSAKDSVSNSNFPWTKIPLVTFVGEEALDCGGPRREFFRILMMEVQRSLGIFEGQPGHLFFTYDQMALEEHKYELAGKLIAWSVAHGGPGLKSLDPCLYQLMSTQECQLVDFDWHLIPDADIQDKLQKISSCKTRADLQRLQTEQGDWICECGFPGIYRRETSIRDVPKIYSFAVRHYIYLRTLNMIHQFTKGLNAYGQFWDMVRTHWVEFLPIFTNMHEPLSRGTFRDLFQIHWSKSGTKKREAEEQTIHCWELVLKMIEDKIPKAPHNELHFEEILAFITGADEVPPLGFSQKPSIHFYQPEQRGCRLPFANTCMMGLFLPRVVKDEVQLYRMILRAIRDSAVFGRT